MQVKQDADAYLDRIVFFLKDRKVREAVKKLDLRAGWDLNDPAQCAKMWSFATRKCNFDCWKLEWAWCQDDAHEVDD